MSRQGISNTLNTLLVEGTQSLGKSCQANDIVIVTSDKLLKIVSFYHLSRINAVQTTYYSTHWNHVVTIVIQLVKLSLKFRAALSVVGVCLFIFPIEIIQGRTCYHSILIIVSTIVGICKIIGHIVYIRFNIDLPTINE